MTTFRVGQRVRIKWSQGWPELAGEAGTIIRRSTDAGVAGDSEWSVAPDVWGTNEAPHRGSHGASCFGPSSAQLEPLSDSNTLVSWESMRDLWMPEHLRLIA